MTARVPRPRAATMITVWLTRDSDADGLYPFVDVWRRCPDGARDEVGRLWSTDDSAEDQIGRYSIEDARRKFKTLPDDDRQCVRCYIKGV